MCGLCKYTEEIPTHYVGSDKSIYEIDKFRNWGIGGLGNFYKGKEDLPMHLYPYTIKYEIRKKFKCCEKCT